MAVKKKKVRLSSFEKAQQMLNEDYMTADDLPQDGAAAGANAAAKSISETLPERQALATSQAKLKSSQSAQDFNSIRINNYLNNVATEDEKQAFMNLSTEEQISFLDTLNARKRKVNFKAGAAQADMAQGL